MKQVIDGRVFNTQTAKFLGSWSNGHFCTDFDYASEDLYRSPRGIYFLHCEGGARSAYGGRTGKMLHYGQCIRPLDKAEARTWAEGHLAADEYLVEFEAEMA